jgi:tRNA pseudouridine38-40 synthase
MNYYKALLQYIGTDRMGFQMQEGLETIQGDLNLALSNILQGEFSTRAASRTDKGVHAFAQVIKISIDDSTPLTLERLNQALPSHMKCIEITNCSPSFIPSIDQRSKEYRYFFSSHPNQDFIAHAPEALDIEAMKTCVAMLVGRHDFKNFWSIGGVSNTTEREILECDLSLFDPRDLFKDSLFSAGEVETAWQFRIVGSGFLKHMVRHIVGALFLVGKGEISVQKFSDYLKGELREQRPWKKADPKGLYLLKVSYE